MLSEKQCKEAMTNDLLGVKLRIEELLEEINDTDLVDVSFSLERIERGVAEAKSRLADCEDY